MTEELNNSYSGLAGFGFFTSLTGQLLGTLSSYYGAKGSQYELESQALSQDQAAFESRLNARNAENDANAIFEAGQRESFSLGLRHQQDRAAVKVEQATSGTDAGSGSNAEVLASQRFLQQLDAMTLNANTVREANNARLRATNERNQSGLHRASAANLRGTARSVNPYLAGGASLLGSASTLSNQWVYLQRYRGGTG